MIPDSSETMNLLLATANHGAAAAGALGSGWLFGWTGVDVPMLVCLPVLLLFSGFFSGSETALFGMNEAQRMKFRNGASLAERAVDALLVDQRMLLITILLGNMTINVLYFVISSVLMMHSTGGALVRTCLAATSLLLIVLLGEVGPKMLANATRVRFASVCSPLLLTFHRLIGPLRVALNLGVISPLSRLTAPTTAPPELDEKELKALLEVSGLEGVIDRDEQRVLHAVLDMQRLKVRDVMTPRVEMTALPTDASRHDVDRAVRQTRLTKLPVYEGDLDHIVGVLHAKRYLLDSRIASVTQREVLTEARFMPEIASLGQLLDHFRRRHTQSAIVVDEYGGTEGIVSVEDVVEELIGDIVGEDEQAVEPPRLIGLGRWTVAGDMKVHDLADAFDIKLHPPKVSTLGGLVTEKLGRAAKVGDVVDFETVRIEVEAVQRSRVISTTVIMKAEGEEEEGTGSDGGRSPS